MMQVGPPGAVSVLSLPNLAGMLTIEQSDTWWPASGTADPSSADASRPMKYR
jgi:hypothetical protein